VVEIDGRREGLLVAQVREVVIVVRAAKGEHLLRDDRAVPVQLERHVGIVEVACREQHQEPVAVIGK
jgi:hypothetical protein